MAHNTRIKPQVGDAVGLTELYAKIGTNIANCRVLATHFVYDWRSDQVQFEAIYFWNNTAAEAWIVNNAAVDPIRIEQYGVNLIDLDKSMVDQCLDYLLTLPQFNGSQGAGTLVWVKQ